MGRVKLPFAPGLEVEFTDRDRAIQQVLEWAERSTRFPVVVFGPEGCGKTAWLKQSIEVLKEEEFGVIYLNPMRGEFLAELGIESLRERALNIVRQASSEHALAKLIWSIIDLARDTIKLGKGRVAVIVDDVFHLIGAREASFLVKGLLEIIEYPPESYERIVAIAATSEGVSRREIGRHRWADVMGMWNMSREGFEKLYEKIPSPKPSFKDVWLTTGGNPWVLTQLYQVGWSADRIIKLLIGRRGLDTFTLPLNVEERRWLSEAVKNPDTLLSRERIPLLNKLVELNLVVEGITYRDLFLWIDAPPPEKDLELGIGRYIAWQTPIHREAVRRILEST